jgi:hypothetical protein
MTRKRVIRVLTANLLNLLHLLRSASGPRLPSTASAWNGSYRRISCRHWDGSRRLKMTRSRHVLDALAGMNTVAIRCLLMVNELKA